MYVVFIFSLLLLTCCWLTDWLTDWLTWRWYKTFPPELNLAVPCHHQTIPSILDASVDWPKVGFFSIFSYHGAIISGVSNKIDLTFLEIMKPNVRRSDFVFICFRRASLLDRKTHEHTNHKIFSSTSFYRHTLPYLFASTPYRQQNCIVLKSKALNILNISKR